MVGVRRVPEVSQVVVSSQGQSQNPLPPLLPAARKSLFDNIDFSKPPPGLFPAGTSAPSFLITSEENLLPPGTEADEELASQLKDNSVNTTAPFLSVDNPSPLPKPSIDLFKEIFENSSSDSEPEVEEPEPSKSKSVPKTKESASGSGPSTVMKRDDKESRDRRDDKREFSGVKGIFDNLDFTQLDSQNRSKESGMKEMESSRNPSFVRQKSNEIDEEEDVYGPRLGPTPPTQPSTSKYSQSLPIFSSKSRLNPNSRAETRQFPEPNELEDEEVVWVEKSEVAGSSHSHSERRRDRDSSSSKKKESNKLHHHKKKKSKEKSHHKDRVKSKSKKGKVKSKKDHKSKSKKIRKSRRTSSSSSDDESHDSNSSRDEDDKDHLAIRIHQSLSNKALLSKLKEITQFK